MKLTPRHYDDWPRIADEVLHQYSTGLVSKGEARGILYIIEDDRSELGKAIDEAIAKHAAGAL
jgi:hypothetical protein